MLDSGSASIKSGGVTATSKVVDVLLLLGINSDAWSKDACITYITHIA